MGSLVASPDMPIGKILVLMEGNFIAMTARRQFLVKAASLDYLVRMPAKEAHQILERIRLLALDPLPDGNGKKQVRYMNKKCYRARSGRYRIIYDFNFQYIKLLDIRLRGENTYKDDVVDDLELDEDDLEFEFVDESPLEGEDEGEAEEDRVLPTHWTMPQQGRPLPEPITVDLLEQLAVPPKYHTRLLLVTSDEALLSCPGVEEAELLKLYEHMFERAVTLGLPRLPAIDNNALRTSGDEQQHFAYHSLPFRLSPEQEKYARWSMHSTTPTVLKGGPGTGKTTVAFHRITSFLKHATDKTDLHVLFVAYNKVLVNTARTHLQQLLGPDLRYVTIDTADKLATRVVGQSRTYKELLDTHEALALTQQAIEMLKLEGNFLQRQIQKQALSNISPTYVLQELDSIIVARQITTWEEYQITSRSGCKVRLNWVQRNCIWKIYEHWMTLVQETGKETWSQRRARAASLVELTTMEHFYDLVLIDDAQDLDPCLLAMLARLCKTPGALFVTVDANQAMHYNHFAWSDLYKRLQFRGRPGLLHLNYRASNEISAAARSYLSHGALEQGDEEVLTMYSGPQPDVCAVPGGKEEADLLVAFLRQSCLEWKLSLDSCAVLCASIEAAAVLASALVERGLDAVSLDNEHLNPRLMPAGVRVLTFQQARGLEFPIVALAGFVAQSYPLIPGGASHGERTELLASARRNIYVGMTRAMRALLVIIPSQPTTYLFHDFYSTYWNVGTRIRGHSTPSD